MALCTVCGGNASKLVPVHNNPEIAAEMLANHKRKHAAKEVLSDCSRCLPLVRTEELAVGEGPKADRMGKREQPYHDPLQEYLDSPHLFSDYCFRD